MARSDRWFLARALATFGLVMFLMVWCFTTYDRWDACSERGGVFVRTVFFFDCVEDQP